MENRLRSAVLLLLAAPALATASSMFCGTPSSDPSEWAQEALEKGDAVFLGRIISKKPATPPQGDKTESQSKTKGDDPDGARSMAELLELIESGQSVDSYKFDEIVLFDVVRAWKEPVLPVVRARIRSKVSRRYGRLESGDLRLVVGRDLEDSLYWIRSICDDVIPKTLAEKYIEALDRELAANAD